MIQPERIENAAVSGCCFGMQDHLNRFRTFAKTGIGRGETRFAQTVSPSDANAKIRSRKIVSIPAKAARIQRRFFPVFFLPFRTPHPNSMFKRAYMHGGNT